MAQHIHIHLGKSKKTADRKVKDFDFEKAPFYLLKQDTQFPMQLGWRRSSNMADPKIFYVAGSTVFYQVRPGYFVPHFAKNGTPFRMAESNFQKVTRDNAKDFQPNITAKGRNYVSTGKMRKSASGEMEAEYEELGANKERTGRFLWIAASGLAKNDSARDAAEKFIVRNMQGQTVKVFSTKREADIYVSQHQPERLNVHHVTADSTESTQDSEENDAYIKGHADGIAGKRQDAAYHPGGNKKPSVALKYAEGYRQGEKDRKDGGGK